MNFEVNWYVASAYAEWMFFFTLYSSMLRSSWNTPSA